MTNTPPVNTKCNSLQKLNEITLLRCIAILSLVIHHVLCIYLSDSWGGIETPMNVWYAKFSKWFIPEANMPLFTFIAGYLMQYQIKQNRYESLSQFVNKKVHRLFIPYIVLGALMVLLQPGIPGGYNGLIYGVPNHMWYCLMLFYCYLLFYIMSNYTTKWLNTFMAMASLLVNIKYGNMWSLYYDWHIIGGFELAAYFYFWFWLGTLMFENKKLLYTQSGFVILMTLYIFCHGILREMAFIIILLLSATWVTKKWKLPESVQYQMDTFAKYGFGIYVLHHLILWDMTHLDVISQYVLPLCESQYFLMPMCMFLFALCVSYLLTHLFIRTSVGRYLLS